MTIQDLAHPQIVTSDAWLAARKTLLAHEKELTKHYLVGHSARSTGRIVP
jgi:predicted dithiol-disulfide oxidoreductase (DUF899 family)